MRCGVDYRYRQDWRAVKEENIWPRGRPNKKGLGRLMTISSMALRRIAKLPPEAMAEMLLILADQEEIEEIRKEKQRERTQRHRDKNVTVTPMSRYSDVTPSLDKEIPPKPPKEINSLPIAPSPPKGGSVPTGTASNPEVRQAFDAYNVMAERIGISVAQRLTKPREARLRARLKEAGMDGWERALARVEASPFLRGETGDGFRCGFDFVVSESNFLKINEGKYDRKPNGTGPPQAPVRFKTVEEIEAEVAAERAAANGKGRAEDLPNDRREASRSELRGEVRREEEYH